MNSEVSFTVPGKKPDQPHSQFSTDKVPMAGGSPWIAVISLTGAAKIPALTRRATGALVARCGNSGTERDSKAPAFTRGAMK